MPKRDDIRSVMVIGSGPIVIGQACEFDYSGTQACRVLRDEGLRVIGGVEEAAVLIGEVLDGDVEQQPCEGQPCVIAGRLEQREEPLGDIAVVAQHALVRRGATRT